MTSNSPYLPASHLAPIPARTKYSTKEEIYRHLSIDIVKEKPDDVKPAAATASPASICDEASVENSLAAFFQPGVREIKCEKCENGTHAEQTLHILSRYVATDALLVQLQRIFW